MTPRGFRNNNPCNIRRGSAWKGLRKVQTDPAFCQFTTMQYGLRATFKLLRNYISGFDGKIAPHNTIAKIITRWAPPNENATAKYINYVAGKCNLQPSDVVWFGDRDLMIRLVEAMMMMESGQVCDRQIILAAYDMVNN